MKITTYFDGLYSLECNLEIVFFTEWGDDKLNTRLLTYFAGKIYH